MLALALGGTIANGQQGDFSTRKWRNEISDVRCEKRSAGACNVQQHARWQTETFWKDYLRLSKQFSIHCMYGK